MKSLDEYLALAYTVVLRKDEDGDIVARVDELPGCVAHGSDRVEALNLLDEIKREWIADALERGQKVPEPSDEEDLPSGKWVQRVPRSLHARLSSKAKREGVSLNLFVTTILAEAIGQRSRSESAVPVPEVETAATVFVLPPGFFSVDPSSADIRSPSSAFVQVKESN